MKKMIAMALISALALPGAAMGAAQLPSSEKMLNDYSRYAVVYTSDEERVYVDTETIERDPANAGELPVIRGTLYAEVYKDPLTYPDYGNYRMVEYIFQYETAVGADQYGREIRYRILNKLQGVYTPDGKPAVYRGVHDEPADEADDIYAAMYRLSKNY